EPLLHCDARPLRINKWLLSFNALGEVFWLMVARYGWTTVADTVLESGWTTATAQISRELDTIVNRISNISLRDHVKGLDKIRLRRLSNQIDVVSKQIGSAPFDVYRRAVAIFV